MDLVSSSVCPTCAETQWALRKLAGSLSSCRHISKLVYTKTTLRVQYSIIKITLSGKYQYKVANSAENMTWHPNLEAKAGNLVIYQCSKKRVHNLYAGNEVTSLAWKEIKHERPAFQASQRGNKKPTLCPSCGK